MFGHPKKYFGNFRHPKKYFGIFGHPKKYFGFFFFIFYFLDALKFFFGFLATLVFFFISLFGAKIQNILANFKKEIISIFSPFFILKDSKIAISLKDFQLP